MADKFSKHLATLSKRGRHRVLVGDLDYAGLPGKIYTPAEGNGLPAIVFAHDWLKDISVYHATLRHLASWGFVVAAPNTEKGFSPNHRGFAADIETSLQILTGVKLGSGNITVAPGRLGIVGHGMGAGAAVLAAVNRPQLAAIAALYPSQTTPSAELASGNVEAPGLILGTEDNALFDYGNAAKLAAHWKERSLIEKSMGLPITQSPKTPFSNLSQDRDALRPPHVKKSVDLSPASCSTVSPMKTSTRRSPNLRQNLKR